MSLRPHPPTQRRLQQAWRRGEVAISGVVIRSAVLAVALILLPKLVESLIFGVRQHMVSTLTHGPAPLQLWRLLETLLALLGPLLGACALTALAAGAVQTRGNLSFQRLSPTLSRLNPALRLVNVALAENFTRLLKSLLAAALIAGLGLGLAFRHVASLGAVIGDVARTLRVMGTLSERLGWLLAGASALLAAVDFAWVHRNWRARLRMSDAELKQERRNAEADSAVKAERQQIHQRSIREAAKSGLLPTLYVCDAARQLVVGLHYTEGSDEPPRVTSLARGRAAEADLSESEATGVPLFVENELASLLAETPPFETIAPAAFERTAELIASLLRDRQVSLSN